MIDAVILVFERIGQEEYKTVPFTKVFTESNTLGDVVKWAKDIDTNKDISSIYFNTKEEGQTNERTRT